jgi:hypothetical protein
MTWDPEAPQFRTVLGEWGQLEALLHEACLTATNTIEERHRSASKDWRAEWELLHSQRSWQRTSALALPSAVTRTLATALQGAAPLS